MRAGTSFDMHTIQSMHSGNLLGSSSAAASPARGVADGAASSTNPDAAADDGSPGRAASEGPAPEEDPAPADEGSSVEPAAPAALSSSCRRRA